MDVAQPQATNVGIPPKESNPSVFTSYIREAKAYDEAMVARWRIAMEGILLFAALFSAVVTAFIIESYKLLSPDPANLTLLILYQISQQLANGSQTVALIPNPSQIPFSPSILAVLTNFFWFLSLALSLTCALAATLIQQWGSEYNHAIERRQTPEMRGRIRAFLFEGVERSKVSAIVEGTPALLHASLFSFLIGLVFFLHPINNAVTYLMSSLLIICGTAYFYATIAPLISIDSPIRTPLTTFLFRFPLIRNTLRIVFGTCWMKSISAAHTLLKSAKELVRRSIHLLHQLSILFSQHTLNNTNIPERGQEEQRSLWSRVSSLAQKVFPHRMFTTSADQMLNGGNLDEIREKFALDTEQAGFVARETRALTWTLDCLTTDTEFMLFIEGIPSYVEHTRQLTGGYVYDVIDTLLRYDDCVFARQLSSLVRQPHRRERSMSSALDLVSSLAFCRAFPCNFFPEEKQYVWDVIPFYTLFLAPRMFPSLSSATLRARFFVILQCSEDLNELDRPNLHREYFRHVVIWVQVYMDDSMDIDGYSALLREKELDECRLSLDALRLSRVALDHIQLDGPEAKAAMAACNLLALCDLVFKEVSNLYKILEMEPGHFGTAAITRFTMFTQFLASGSPREQQAYASAVWLITAVLAHYRESPGINDPDSISYSSISLIPILRPLGNITDANAMQTVKKIFASSVWWEEAREVLGHLQNSQILQDSVIAPIFWVKGLTNLIYGYDTTYAALAAHLDQRPFTLAGLPSLFQTEFVRCLNWFGNRDRNGRGLLRRFVAAASSRIVGTLDDAKAVILATQYLKRTILQFDDLYENLDQTYRALHLLDAEQALQRLKETATQPGFAYKALALRLEE